MLMVCDCGSTCGVCVLTEQVATREGASSPGTEQHAGAVQEPEESGKVSVSHSLHVFVPQACGVIHLICNVSFFWSTRAEAVGKLSSL